MPFKFTILKKLLLASTSLLIIPWIGYQYILEMQSYLYKNMENDLLAKVRLIAASLHERPALFNNQSSASFESVKPITTTQHLYVRPIKNRIKLDGHSADWANGKRKISLYGKENDLLKNPDSDLAFSMQLGSKKHSLYILFKVKDDKLVFRDKRGLRLDRSDHLIIALQNKQGEYARYLITPKKSGWVTAYKINTDGSKPPEIRIKGSWLKTRTGYTIEIRIPTYLIDRKISFAIADVDDKTTRRIKSIIATANIDSLDELGTIVVPSPQVEKLLTNIKQQNTRIWVVNNAFQVIALSDQLLNSTPDYIAKVKQPEKQPRSILSGLMHLIYQQFLTQPASRFIDDLSTASQLNTPEVISALKGQATTAWRNKPASNNQPNRVSILTATHPIYSLGQVVGAVAIEETSNNILLLQNQAMEILINLSILTFIIAFFVLVSIALRLSSRIRKLRDEADHAISSDGKVTGHITPSNSQDEIGDLTRSTADMLDRLSQYNRYLEGMASKLAHELRTPITVVRSSIENMEHADATGRATYLQRASAGIERLNNILTRMSEASRLEQTLQTEEFKKFNLAELVHACVAGYQQANSSQRYSLQLDDSIVFNGSPDLVAQLLDKLVSNANDYCKADTDIIILLYKQHDKIILKVINQGEPLQQAMLGNLFDSMVSLRKNKTDEIHLGLGLHIVKLIAAFYHGSVNAYNTDNSMVCFEISFPFTR